MFEHPGFYSFQLAFSIIFHSYFHSWFVVQCPEYFVCLFVSLYFYMSPFLFYFILSCFIFQKGHNVVLEKKIPTQNFYNYNINEIMIQTQI